MLDCAYGYVGYDKALEMGGSVYDFNRCHVIPTSRHHFHRLQEFFGNRAREVKLDCLMLVKLSNIFVLEKARAIGIHHLTSKKSDTLFYVENITKKQRIASVPTKTKLLIIASLSK